MPPRSVPCSDTNPDTPARRTVSHLATIRPARLRTGTTGPRNSENILYLHFKWGDTLFGDIRHHPEMTGSIPATTAGERPRSPPPEGPGPPEHRGDRRDRKTREALRAGPDLGYVARVRNPPKLFTGAVLSAALLTGCSANDTAAPASSPAATYRLTPRPVRPSERPITAAPVTDGDTRFQVIGLQTGLAGFVGSHGEWQAKGQYVVVRIVAENPGRTNSHFDANRQRILTSDGAAYAVDRFAQAIKRQPDTFLLGAEVRVEMDLWFDIPKTAKVTAIRLFGDPPLGTGRTTDGVTVPLT